MADQPSAAATRSRPPRATTSCSPWRSGYGVDAGRGRLPLSSGPAPPATSNPGHRRGPRRLHPLRPVRPRLRRDPVQRRDRPQRQGRRDPHRASTWTSPMGASSCVACGECVGGLPDRRAHQQADPRHPDRARATELDQVDTRLPVLRRRLRRSPTTWTASSGAIAFAEGRDQPGSTRARLCVKGRYGFDYAAAPPAPHHAADPHRLGLPQGALSADVRGEMNGRRARTAATAGDGRKAARTANGGAGAGQAAWSTTPRCCRTSARPPGRRRWTWWRQAAAPASASDGGPRRARRLRLGQVHPTRRPTCSRS